MTIVQLVCFSLCHQHLHRCKYSVWVFFLARIIIILGFFLFFVCLNSRHERLEVISWYHDLFGQELAVSLEASPDGKIWHVLSAIRWNCQFWPQRPRCCTTVESWKQSRAASETWGRWTGTRERQRCCTAAEKPGRGARTEGGTVCLTKPSRHSRLSNSWEDVSAHASEGEPSSRLSGSTVRNHL